MAQLHKSILASESIQVSTSSSPTTTAVKVSGAYASQHTVGEAADIYIPKTPYTDWDDNKRHTNIELAKQWFDFLEHHTDFDQLILETSNGRDYWIHVSCRKNAKRNRHQIFRDMRKK